MGSNQADPSPSPATPAPTESEHIPPERNDEREAAPSPEGLPGSLRVSLSGGGIRATLFAFGAVLYLLDSGLNARVRAISSVSGGSIANAVLSVAGDISVSDDVDRHRHRIARASWALAKHGVFFLGTVKGFFVTLFVAGLAFAAYIALLPTLLLSLSGTPSDIPHMYAAAGAEVFGLAAITGVAFLLGVFFATWASRKLFQFQLYERALAYASTDDAKWLSRDHKREAKAVSEIRLSDLEGGAITHVFCATDLVSGYPVFMTREAILNEVYGSGPASLPIGRAVYASAAFPAVFSPLRLPLTDWHGEGREADRPKRMYLSDGGVFNNLGTDWFAATEQAEQAASGGSEATPSGVTASIVVNASKPPRVERRSAMLGMHVPALLRAMTVVQENTVSPRLRLLTREPDTALVDIAQSPAALLAALKAHDSPDVRRRAADLESWFQLGKRADHWTSLAAKTSGERTQLEAVGPERARHLLRHGYMNAAVAAHCVFGSEFTPARYDRDERWFASLISSGERRTAPAR